MDITNFFNGKISNENKLVSYGFNKDADCYVFNKSINDNDFTLSIRIYKNCVKAEIIDTYTGEEYTLHLTECAKGPFINKIKKEYNDIINSILLNCFEADSSIFKENISKKIIKYIKNKYDDDLEFLWQKSPKNAVVRRKNTLKWYAVILSISKNKLGYASDKQVEILDLHINSEDVEKLIMKKGFFPAYHMNKKHWITIVLDGSVDYLEICKLIDESYRLATK